MRGLLAALGAAIITAPAMGGLDYQLKPTQVAQDTYVFIGRTEDFTRANGGNIANTGFIVTQEGVVVIDTGPSRLYGEQMREAIGAVTSKPINRVFITHHHPDHYFGNQVFADVPIHALSETIDAMKAEGSALSDNLYRMSGDWMKGTEPVPASNIAAPGVVKVGEHALELIPLRGHTRGDLAIFDRMTGVLFAGDLVFNRRAVTTPHADIDEWLEALAVLQRHGFKLLVPGHGNPVADARAIEQTRHYLTWLQSTMLRAAFEGMDMPELLAAEMPADLAGIPLARSEYERSVVHLFRAFETKVLEGAR